MDPKNSALDAAIGSIYEAAVSPSSWPRALEQASACTGDVGAVLIWTREDGSFGTITSPSLKDAQREYEDRWWREDVRASRAVKRSYWLTSDVITDQDVVSPEEIETLPIYTDFLIRHGLGWVASVGVSPDPALHAALTVQRAMSKAPFSADEKEVIALLGRHIERALRIGSKLVEWRTTVESLADALRRMDVAVFALDGADRVLFMNDAASSVLATSLQIYRQRLMVRIGGERMTLKTAFLRQREERRRVSDLAALLLERSTGSHLVLFDLPITVGGEIYEAFLQKAEKLILVVAQDATSSVDPSILRDLFGLTAAEARLAAIVGRGASPREAAATLTISEETARSVLKRVYEKTETRRQSQLATLLGSIGLRA